MTVRFTRGVDRKTIDRMAGLALAALLGTSGAAAAQNLSSASINGTVSDESGGALPGVTVTADRNY